MVFAVVMASLILSPMRVSSKVLPEQECRSRPTVVPVQKEGYKPYHIELHRCSGTCQGAPPSHRPCTPTSRKAITLELTDLTTGKPGTVTVYNHTRCGCGCELECKLEEGEFPDEENCKCIVGPNRGEGRNDKDKNTESDVLPYQIGIAVIGFFALCVLVFDMIMCGKDKGVLYKVKEKCCKSDQVDNKDVTLRNGKGSSTKEKTRPVEVHHV